MALMINNNVAAFNSYRNLSATQGHLGKSLEKLSSGFRINRAADDAAGLAISEGLRSQVGGLKQAVRNAQDGISVVQTAEGALAETHSILQRMRDLSVQAGNDGGLSDAAKENIKAEMDQLNSELTRIADTTTFNGEHLLDGTYAGAFQVGANVGESISFGVQTANGKGLNAEGLNTASINITESSATTSFEFADPGISDGDTLSVGGQIRAVLEAGDTAADAVAKLNASFAENDEHNLFAEVIDGGHVRVHNVGSSTPPALVSSNGDIEVAVDNSVQDVAVAALASVTELGGRAVNFVGLAQPQLIEAVNDLTASTGIRASIDGADVRLTKIDGTGVGPMLDSSGELVGTASDEQAASDAMGGAKDALVKLDAAISSTSTIRAEFGAVQNRFDHTINNLNVAVENLSASESRIRDTDMAAEMVQFQRHQVMNQAGTAMLAQANQLPQSIMQLLQ